MEVYVSVVTESSSAVRSLPSGFVTFLFTDIEGSTRLFRQLGDGYVPLLERHHELLREVWSEHRGVEVKTEGDAFLVAFGDPGDAVAAAASAQQALAAEKLPLRVRMGIHSGLASPRDGDYIAYAVHQAARVVGAAHGGQIIVSGATRSALPEPDRSLRSLGRFRVRDFEEPVELFEVAVEGSASVTAPPRATPAMGHNLTPPPGLFVGRQAEIAELAELVAPGAVVSIVGAGGAGKTRLAVELSLARADDWPDGVWLVELAALGAQASVAGAAAEAIGVSVADRDPVDALIDELGAKSCMLVLDNCEHIVEAVGDLVATLVRRTPGVAVLATSREPLGIAHERVWRIGPLSEHGPAVDLFVDRAGLTTPTDDDAAVIQRICGRLGGNPLAIELAAARAQLVGLTALESALADRFKILSSRRRDLEPRQRSMTAVLDWSHDLLESHEQTVFERLGLFPDSFSLDGAEVVCGGAVAPGDVVDAVWALVDKSLLGADPSANQTRFAMSETVRDYALTRLDSDNRRAGVGALAAWYLDSYGPWTALEPEQLSDLRVELDNVDWIIEAVGETQPNTAQLLALPIAYLRDVSGELADGILQTDRYLRSLPHPSVERALLLGASARLRARRGDRDTGRLLDEAERLLAVHGPEPEWAAGTIAILRAYWLESAGRHTEALSVAESVGAPGSPLVAQARSWAAVGILRGSGGDDDGALEAHRRGLAIEEQLGGAIEVAVGHNNVAEYALRLGHVDSAASHQRRTLDLAEQIGSVSLVAFSLIIAARVSASRDDWPGTVLLHGAADRWLEESGTALFDADAAISNRLLDEARRRLDDYEQVRARGWALELPQAVAAARTALS